MKPALLGSLAPFTRILFFILLVISSLVVAMVIAMLIAPLLFGISIREIMTALSNFGDPSALNLLRYFQVVQSFGLFIIPSLLAGLLFEGNALRYVKANWSPGAGIYAACILLLLCMVPFLNWMISANEALKLPASLRSLEEWMQGTETRAAALTDAFLDVKTAGGFLFNLFLIGALPGIGEELLFRGVLQRLFRDWLRSIHAAIFLSALLFTLLHMQFYGFLPRFFLGVILGYMFYWTGSLWVPIFFHFLNNAAAVFLTFLEHRGVIGGAWQDPAATDNAILIIGSAILTGLMLWMIRAFFSTQRGEGTHRPWTP
jgi:uncharacterized protein